MYLRPCEGPLLLCLTLGWIMCDSHKSGQEDRRARLTLVCVCVCVMLPLCLTCFPGLIKEHNKKEEVVWLFLIYV